MEISVLKQMMRRHEWCGHFGLYKPFGWGRNCERQKCPASTDPFSSQKSSSIAFVTKARVRKLARSAAVSKSGLLGPAPRF